jgi:hypothetical protein
VNDLAKISIGLVLGLAMGCLALAPLGGFDVNEGERIRCLSECRPAINLVMIGSSVVREHFIPHVFDAEMRKRGRRIHSLNLGVEGMNDYEKDIVLDGILGMDLPKLRWIFLDITAGANPNIFLHDNQSDRTIRWHSLRQMRRMYDFYAATGMGTLQSLTNLARHLDYVALRYANVGRGVRAIREARREEMGPPELPHRGYARIDTLPAQPTGIIAQRGKGRVAWEKRLAAALEKLEEPIEPTPAPYLDEWSERVSRFGKEAIFVRTPALYINHMPAEGVRDLDPVPFFDFADPERYPALYKLESRYDRRHLSHLGATRYTKRLAEAFAAHLDRESH